MYDKKRKIKRGYKRGTLEKDLRRLLNAGQVFFCL